MSRENLEISLMHHGIKGQEWGVKHGPPYPLSDAKHNKIVNGGGSEDKKKFTEHDEAHSSTRSDKSAKEKHTAENIMTLVSCILNPMNIAIVLATKAQAGIESKHANSVAARIEAEREQEPLDEESGLHRKEPPFTESEMIKRVNPDFKNLSVDTKNNCMLCTFAMELQERGYDAGANKAKYGYTDEFTSKMFKGAKKENFGGDPTTSSEWFKMARDRKTQKEARESVKQRLNGFESGARGNLTVTWKESPSGHSVFWKMTDSGLKIIDTQTGQTYTGGQIDRFLKQAISFNVTRLDQCSVDWEVAKEAVH